MTTYNLPTIEFEHWRALWRDLITARSIREACGYAINPPGWRPDNKGETTEDLRRSFAPCEMERQNQTLPAASKISRSH